MMIHVTSEHPPIYLANPEVARCTGGAGGTLILINPDTNAIRGINPTGLMLWHALAQPCTADQLASYLLEECAGVPADQVAADVKGFLALLLPDGFVGRVLEPDCADFRLEAGAEVPPDAPHTSVSEDVGDDCLRFYRGHSMLGTFRPGDHLTVEPVAIAAIRAGDVVLYRGRERAGRQREVVHRVVAVLPDGLVTRGDNNRGVDHVLVTQDKLLGRITHLAREGKVHPVRGGRWGRLHVRLLRGRGRVRRLGGRFLRATGRRTYRWLRESGVARRLWRPAIVRVLVATGDGPLVKYASSRRTVAHWWPETGRFWCRRPYDLLISPPGKREFPPRGQEATHHG